MPTLFIRVSSVFQAVRNSYSGLKTSPRLHSVQRNNLLSFIDGKQTFPNFTFVHTATQGVKWDRQLLLGNYTDHKDSSMMKEIRKHLYFQFLPAPPLYWRPPGTRQSPLCSFICPVYNYTELGHSYLAGRVLRVMAKLPSWHCPIKTYSCVPILENQSSTLQGCMDVPIQPRQQQRRQPGAPKRAFGNLRGAQKQQPRQRGRWHFSTSMSTTLPGTLIKLQGRCYDHK